MYQFARLYKFLGNFYNVYNAFLAYKSQMGLSITELIKFDYDKISSYKRDNRKTTHVVKKSTVASTKINCEYVEKKKILQQHSLFNQLKGFSLMNL